MSDSWMLRKLEPGLVEQYSRSSVFMTSTMKSEPGRSTTMSPGSFLSFFFEPCFAPSFAGASCSAASGDCARTVAATAPQVRQAIVTAGTALGWKIADAGPGKLQGTLSLRTHTAVVEIPYSATKYSILYKSSEGLGESGGTIHGNYNGWVQNLDRAI